MKNKIKIIENEDLHDENEDVVSSDGMDEIEIFIRKTQLQNQVLKKLTENLSRTTDKERKEDKSRPDQQE